jgi:hypothetical protein
MSARPLGDLPDLERPLTPLDTREIAEARFVTVEEIKGDIRAAMIRSKSTGLRYRAELTDLVIERLVRDGLLTPVSPDSCALI